MAIRVFDDLGRPHLFPVPPRRIVSLVPSETYNVVALGARARLVGRTDYCVEPADLVGRVPAVGGTKNPRVADVLAQAPDLVLANQEENTQSDLAAIVAAGVPVFVAFPKRVAEGIAQLARLARILGVEKDAGVQDLLRRGYHALREAEEARATRRPLRAFVPIWMDPLMTIHGDTFISDMMDLAGAQNVFVDRPRRYPLAADLGKAPALPAEKIAGRDTRYPRVTAEELVQRAPEIVLLPDEPHPFTDADADVFRAMDLPAARFGTILRCSGKDLCWSGAQSIEGLPRARAMVDALRDRVPEPTQADA